MKIIRVVENTVIIATNDAQFQKQIEEAGFGPSPTNTSSILAFQRYKMPLESLKWGEGAELKDNKTQTTTDYEFRSNGTVKKTTIIEEEWGTAELNFIPQKKKPGDEKTPESS